MSKKYQYLFDMYGQMAVHSATRGWLTVDGLKEKWNTITIQDDGYARQESIQAALAEFHDGLGLSWPKIAALPFLTLVPPSTLNTIYRDGIVPKKWWGYLMVRADNKRRIALSLEDDVSAFGSMINNMEPEFIAPITYALIWWLDNNHKEVFDRDTHDEAKRILAQAEERYGK